MSMKLNAVELEDLAQQLVKLRNLGISVQSFAFGSHHIWLSWPDGASSDGTGEPYVVGISQDKAGGLRDKPPIEVHPKDASILRGEQMRRGQ